MSEYSESERQFLDESHEIGDELLVAMDRACHAVGVDYFIFYGTLLGAVRHSDWIPWDDDIDVAMFREDFERFRCEANPHLPEHMRFSDSRSDPLHVSSIPRILHLGTERAVFARPRRQQAPETKHVALDIFVLDEAPAAGLRHWLWRERIRMLDMLVLATGTRIVDVFRHSEGSHFRKFAELCGVIVSKFAPSATWRNAHVAACQNYQGSGGNHVSLTNGWTLSTRAARLAVDTVKPAQPIQFGSLRVKGPHAPLQILTKIYGPDYMTPPATALRRPSHIQNGLIVDRPE